MSEKDVEIKIQAAEWFSNYNVEYLDAKKLIEQWILEGFIQEKGDYHIQIPKE